MSRVNHSLIENLALKFRTMAGLSQNEPVHVKTLLVKMGVVVKYRPLSDNVFGLSLKTPDDRYRFVLVNSNTSRGRQHFTIGHELYHLYFDPMPQPHVCDGKERDKSEMDANAFASYLLLPKEGIVAEIPSEELKRDAIRIGTVLRLEQIFSVSHEAMAYRLKHMGIISEARLQDLLGLPIKDMAAAYGFDLSLYDNGNKNLLIGDYGEKLRELYDRGSISEGHYMELHKHIYND
ncbi:MAG: ImmA/IrrE family metallo-endopeptidase [Prevotella sp.]|nr:ImmA/IrrE family metallo-endopeptidase [Prevotella sp.]